MKITIKQQPGNETILAKFFFENKDDPMYLDFKGEKDTVMVVPSSEENYKRLMLVGLGPKEKLDLEGVRCAASNVILKTRSLRLENVAIELPSLEAFNPSDVAFAIAEGVVLKDYLNRLYKKDEKKKPIAEVALITQDAEAIKAPVSTAQKIAENVNFTRNIVNQNADALNPKTMAETAKKIAKDGKLKITVLEESRLKKEGLNLLLAVGQGAAVPPRLIILEYRGDPKSKENYAVVGKGVTFDSGGLNLKPTGYMETMRQDMHGAATVLGVMKTVSELKPKKNIIGVIPTAENAIGSKSYKPGDVFKSYSGKTVEILNTDAEGRLILADALAYTVKNYKPDYIIDFATLTGAIVVCLGDAATGLFSNNDELAAKIAKAADKTNERVWRMPVFDEFKEEMKSDIADLKNVGYKNGRAGSSTAAAFLEHFVGETKWAHLDIAGTGWLEKPKHYMPKAATGVGVRLMTEFFLN